MRWIERPDRTEWDRIAALCAAALRAPRIDGGLVNRLCDRLVADIRRTDEACEILARAVAKLPDDADLRAKLAKILIERRQLDRARSELDIALKLMPESRAARIQHFNLLMRTNQLEAALLMSDEIARIDPRNPVLYSLRLLSETPDAQSVAQLAACEAELAENPAATNATYFKAITLARLGRDDEARATFEIDRYLHIEDLDAPPGFADAAAFRVGLTEEIGSNPHFIAEFHTTRGALTTVQPQHKDAAHMAAIVPQIRAAIEAYSSRLSPDDGPFAARRPDQARLNLWAVLYRPEGYQLPHCHPSGWLSGVYYVAAPRQDGESAFRGPLMLGEVPARYHVDQPPWGIREIEPVPGRIVLFPSYVPHATRPTNIDGQRICIAFDVVPIQ